MKDKSLKTHSVKLQVDVFSRKINSSNSPKIGSGWRKM